MAGHNRGRRLRSQAPRISAAYRVRRRGNRLGSWVGLGVAFVGFVALGVAVRSHLEKTGRERAGVAAEGPAERARTLDLSALAAPDPGGGNEDAGERLARRPVAERLGGPTRDAHEIGPRPTREQMLLERFRARRATAADDGNSLNETAARTEAGEAASPARSERLAARTPAAPSPAEATASGRAPLPVPRENHYFTLELAATLGGAPLDRNDQQSWARIGYFLQRESSHRFQLVFPSGRIPQIARAADGAPAAGSTAADRPLPAGDPSQPAYRIVLSGKAEVAGTVSFYGTAMARKYAANLVCRVEKHDGKAFRTLTTFAVEERLTPSGPVGDDAKQVRLAYDGALEKVVKRLQTLPLFAR